MQLPIMMFNLLTITLDTRGSSIIEAAPVSINRASIAGQARAASAALKLQPESRAGRGGKNVIRDRRAAPIVVSNIGGPLALPAGSREVQG